MELKELNVLFGAGRLASASILKFPMSDHWVLQINQKSGAPVMLSSQRSDVRLFRTIDAAFKVARDIGFIKVSVESS